MNNQFFGITFAGFCLGIAFMMAALSIAPSTHRQGKEAITECQKSLPRDQVCKITAVPVEKEK